MRLDRDDDFLITGKRHPFSYDYTVGFDDQGRLCGLQLTQLSHCGFSADLSGPVSDRAIFHADNAYFLQDVAISSYRCKTNTQSHTAYRGFGGPQGVIAIETILGDVARNLGLDPLAVRLANLYADEPLAQPLPSVSAHNPTPPLRNVTHYGMTLEDNILLPLIAQLADSCSYQKRKANIAAWNADSPVIQRGLALTPVKFGISFTATLFNQAGALVHVYTDGSVLVNHGGTEMGQGLHTKVAQIVASELGFAAAPRAVKRQRHRARTQCQRHRRQQRHRPEWARRPIRGTQRQGQPGRLCGRAGRLRRRRGAPGLRHATGRRCQRARCGPGHQPHLHTPV
jgi:xanthine dehydrogenase large subunit